MFGAHIKLLLYLTLLSHFNALLIFHSLFIVIVWTLKDASMGCWLFEILLFIIHYKEHKHSKCYWTFHLRNKNKFVLRQFGVSRGMGWGMSMGVKLWYAKECVKWGRIVSKGDGVWHMVGRCGVKCIISSICISWHPLITVWW